MKRPMKWTAMLLTVCLLLCLTACGDRADRKNQTFQTAPAYTAEDLSLPAPEGRLYGSCTDGEWIFYLITAEGSDRPVLCRAPLDGGDAETLAEFHPASTNAGTYYSGPFLDGSGGLWIWEECYVDGYAPPEDFDGTEDDLDRYFTRRDAFHTLRQLDPSTGREKAVLDIGGTIGALLEETDMVRGLTIDGGGNIFVGTLRKLVVLGSGGALLFTLEDRDASGITPFLLSDGSAAALVSTGLKNEVRTVDPEAGDWGEAVLRLPGGVERVFDGRGAYRFFYLRDGCLYGWDEAEELDLRLVDWAGAQVSNCRVRCFALLADGRLAALTQDGSWRSDDGTGSLRLRLFSPSDRLPGEGKTKLTYGVISAGQDLRDRIALFNESHTDCYIQLRDYGEGMLDTSWNAEEYSAAWDAAQTRMLIELSSGRVPDILDSSLPLELCARRGYLADLRPYIDGDPEISRDTLMDHVLECMETDGKLYRICGSFTIQTLSASAGITGGRAGWTLEELLEACGGAPEFYRVDGFSPLTFYLESASGMLYSLTRMNLDRYVDWSTGACSFDGEDFRSVLALCGRFQESTWNDAAGWAAGEGVKPWAAENVLLIRSLGSVWDFTLDDALFGGPEALMDYESLLREKGVLYTEVSSYTGEEVENNSMAPDSVIQAEGFRKSGNYFGRPFSGGAVFGALRDSGYAAYIGYPTQAGTGSSFEVFDCTAMSAACADPDGAWEFIRRQLLPTGEADKAALGARFPISRADFEQSLEPVWIADGDGNEFLDRDGQRVESSLEAFAVGNPVDMFVHRLSPSQEQIDRFYALYSAIDRVSVYERELLNIITEQAEMYFAGDKSLDETAALIQNRASLYVNENR